MAIPQPHPGSRKKIESIQFLRMTAALLITYLHAIGTQIQPPSFFKQYHPRLIDELGIGVDIFFVISGFIITYTATAGNGLEQSLQFLKKRFIRLNPVYYIAFLLFLAFNIHHMLRTYLPPAGAFLKSIFLLPIADKDTWYTCIPPVIWTLNFEWLFYLLFAMSIASPSRNKNMLLGIGILGLAAAHFIPWITDYRLRFLANPILIEFLLGMIICHCYRKYSLPPAVSFLLLAAGISFGCYDLFKGTWMLNDVTSTADGTIALQRAIYRGIPSAFLIAGCLFLEKNGLLHKLWNNRLIVLLGNASYSLYLTHYTTYGLCEAAWLRFHPAIPVGYSIASWFSLATALGVLFYLYVEKPLLAKLSRTPHSKPRAG